MNANFIEATAFDDRWLHGARTRGIGNARRENVRLRSLLMEARESAAEYEFLIREGDHRIKNSLQIVAGLVHVQARLAHSTPAQDALHAAATRIQSIALIHDALQESHGQDAVDVGQIIESMCRSLQAMAGDQNGVNVIVSVEPIKSPVEVARPVILAVNELVINALRHAFTSKRTGTVHVSAAQSRGQLLVIVADNGDGLPPGHSEGRGFGLTLVRKLAAQIGGTLKIENADGAQFTLSAPIPEKMQATV